MGGRLRPALFVPSEACNSGIDNHCSYRYDLTIMRTLTSK